MNLFRDILAAVGQAEASGSWAVVSSVSYDRVSSSHVAAFPAGYQAGDAVLAVISRDSNTLNLVTPSGWEQVAAFTAHAPVLYAYWLPVIAGQTNVVLASSGVSDCTIQLVVFHPTNIPAFVESALLERATAVGSQTNATPDPPELVTTLDRNYIIALGAMRTDNMTLTPPSGFETIIASDGNTRVSQAIAIQEQAVAGAINPAAFGAAGNTEDWAAVTLSLRTRISGAVAISGIFTTVTTDVTSPTAVASPSSISVSMERPSASIGISGGVNAQYRVDGGAWSSSAGVVTNGAVVEVRQTSATISSGTSQSNIATLSVGSATATYELITRRELVLIGTSQDWTVPAGTTAISVVGTGGGGAGGWGFYNGVSTFYGGGGAGGGAMSRTPDLAVSPGDILSITAGLGGSTSNQASGVPGNSGGDSFILRSGSTLWRAKGGGGGGSANSSSNTAGAAGVGGQASSCVGTFRQSGGNGGSGGSGAGVYEAGGGGAGGYTGAGGRGANGSSTPISGTSGTGGAGGGGGNDLGSGGGTGISGAGANGAGGTGATSSSGGGEGSPDNYASAGTTSAGGTSGGGGSGDDVGTGQAGGDGAIRITW
jgi:hypothetical protein